MSQSQFEDPYRCRSADHWGVKGMFRRAAARGAAIGATVISAPRYAPEPRPYVYRGTGRDTLTAHMDAEPEGTATGLTRRQERMQMLASLPPLHCGPEPVPPPGHITAAQAAEQLGVSERTVLRYKSALRTGRAS